MINLPRAYLSYSAIALWLKDPAKFRLRYYENEKFLDNKYTLFGKEVHAAIESGKYPHIPRYDTPEHKVEVVVEGIPVMGYIDSFSSKTKAFLDYKSAMKPWTPSMVQDLEQLPLYSLLIEMIYGKVQPTCKVVWLETKEVKTSVTFKGRVYEHDANKLELTGKIQIFKRVIEPWERERMKKLIRETAEAISDDFKRYKDQRTS